MNERPPTPGRQSTFTHLEEARQDAKQCHQHLRKGRQAEPYEQNGRAHRGALQLACAATTAAAGRAATSTRCVLLARALVSCLQWLRRLASSDLRSASCNEPGSLGGSEQRVQGQLRRVWRGCVSNWGRQGAAKWPELQLS